MTTTLMMMRWWWFCWKMRRNVINIKLRRSSPHSWDVFIWTNYFMYFIAWLKFRNACKHTRTHKFASFILWNGGCCYSGYDQQKFYTFCVCSVFLLCSHVYMKCKTFEWTFPFIKRNRKIKFILYEREARY